MDEIKSFLLTFSFFSRLNFFSPSEKDFPLLFRKSLKYIPFFAFISGLLLFYALKLFFLLLPSPLPAFFIFAFQYFIFNYFHFDGFLDSVDAFLSGRRTKDEILRIMDDTHKGAFAILWGAFFVFVKISLITHITEQHPESVFFMFLFGRFSMLFSVFIFPLPAKNYGLGYLFASQGRAPFIFPLILFSLVLFIFSPVEFFILSLFIFFISFMIKRKIGGFTGDTFGMICEISELAYLFVFFIRVKTVGEIAFFDFPL